MHVSKGNLLINPPQCGDAARHTRTTGRARALEPVNYAVLMLDHDKRGAGCERADTAACIVGRPLRGTVMRNLVRRIVCISCGGIVLVVLEAAWLAHSCRRLGSRR
jgi:hypothetical protein